MKSSCATHLEEIAITVSQLTDTLGNGDCTWFMCICLLPVIKTLFWSLEMHQRGRGDTLKPGVFFLSQMNGADNYIIT